MLKKNTARNKGTIDNGIRDHVSGTGRGKEVQKNGAGKYNWGTSVDDISDPLSPENSSRQRQDLANSDKTITYDEYMAKMKQNTAYPLPEPRKANEGTDESKWAQYIPLKKPDN